MLEVIQHEVLDLIVLAYISWNRFHNPVLMLGTY